MHQARLGSPLLLSQAWQTLVHPQGEIRLDLSPDRTQASMARPDVRIYTSATALAASGSPTSGSDSSASSSTGADPSETPPSSSNHPTPLSTRQKLRRSYPRYLSDHPEYVYALYGPDSSSTLLGDSPRTRAAFALRRSGRRSLLGCALIIFWASWLAVVVFQREHRGNKVERMGLSSSGVVEHGSSVLPIELSSTDVGADTSESEKGIEDDDDEPPFRIQAVGTQLVEQNPIILRFPNDDSDDEDNYARF